MTPRETVIEAAAKAICATFRMPSNKHTDCFSWDDLFLWDDLLEEERNAFRVTARTHLDAILAALPDLGLKIVPIEADEAIAEAWAGASIDTASAGLPDNEVNMLHAQSNWSAMIAAAPDLLGTGKQALKDSK